MAVTLHVSSYAFEDLPGCLGFASPALMFSTVQPVGGKRGEMSETRRAAGVTSSPTSGIMEQS